MNRYLVLLLALTLFSAPQAAKAWDTRVLSCNDQERAAGTCDETWKSAYLGGRSDYLPEHTTISDMALKRLGLRELFGKKGSSAMDVLDLNASLFRREDLGDRQRYGDDENTESEERRIPSPAQFTGIPDYSYTLVDWLNKNVYCPAFPPGPYKDKCHVFMGWLGGFNSPHFGTQAKDMYLHYHELALNLAERAKAFRLSFENYGEELAHLEAIKEAELEALAYEGYAQHFLQDRWAMGHMWERWGAGDSAQSVEGNLWGHHIALGVIAGLIHGTEAVINDPEGIVTKRLTPLRGLVTAADPMSSPAVVDGKAVPMQFRHDSYGSGSTPENAVGDERLTDLRLGHFGAGYVGIEKNMALPGVKLQLEGMLSCSSAGWTSVIRAFGEHKRGGYGAHNAKLPAFAASFDIRTEARCWDMWATNRSLYEGLVNDTAAPIRTLAALTLMDPTIPKGAQSKQTIFKNRRDLVGLSMRLWARKLVDPDGLDMAKGGIGSMLTAKPGNAYHLPEYAEPADPEKWPKEEPRGIDRQTLHGVFNRAHSDALCEDLQDILYPLRGSRNKRDQEICTYLADFAYNGTDRTYGGSMSRKRLHNGLTVRGLCTIRGKEAKYYESGRPDPLVSEGIPFFVDQGYVPRIRIEREGLSEQQQIIRNWCNRLPVLSLTEDKEKRADNFLDEQSLTRGRVSLTGFNLGEQAGQLLIALPGNEFKPLGKPYTWSDNRIEIDFDRSEVEPDTSYEVEVRRADGVASLGYYRLRFKEDVTVVEAPVKFEGTGPCGVPLDLNFQLPGLIETIPTPDKLTVPALTSLHDAVKPKLERAAALLDREANCIMARVRKISDEPVAALVPPPDMAIAAPPPLALPQPPPMPDFSLELDENGMPVVRQSETAAPVPVAPMPEQAPATEPLVLPPITPADLQSYSRPADESRDDPLNVNRFLGFYLNHAHELAAHAERLRRLPPGLTAAARSNLRRVIGSGTEAELTALRQTEHKELVEDFRYAQGIIGTIGRYLTRWAAMERTALRVLHVGFAGSTANFDNLTHHFETTWDNQVAEENRLKDLYWATGGKNRSLVDQAMVVAGHNKDAHDAYDRCYQSWDYVKKYGKRLASLLDNLRLFPTLATPDTERDEDFRLTGKPSEDRAKLASLLSSEKLGPDVWPNESSTCPTLEGYVAFIKKASSPDFLLGDPPPTPPDNLKRPFPTFPFGTN